MSVKMTRYKHAEFADDDSVGSVQLTEGVTSSATHIRFRPSASPWRAMSMAEKFLLGLGGLLLFVVLVLGMMLSHAGDEIAKLRKNQKDDFGPENQTITVFGRNICLNETCIHIASDILEAMDQTVDPCSDFYGYACNGWIENNPIPDGKSGWSNFLKIEHKNHEIIKRVLEQPIDSLKSKAEQKSKQYYESCMDSNDTIESLGAKPMINLLKHIGGWNVTPDTNYDLEAWDLQQTLQLIQNQYNIGALFSYAVGEDDRNSTRHVIQVDQSGLTLPTREHYLNRTEHGKIYDAYLEYMTKVGVLLGGEPVSTRAQMEDVMDFETKLANITVPNDKRRDEEAIYNLWSVKQLQDASPFIDWRKFFEDAMKVVNKKVTSKENIVVYAPAYLGNLSLLINEYQMTESGNTTLNNYLVWQTVYAFVSYLSKPFRDAYKPVRKVMIGSEGGDEPQWKYCVSDTTHALGFAVGAIFVREVFHGDSRPLAEAMVTDVKNAFKDNFKNLDWMDTETRKAAEIKADAISDMIGYPNFIEDLKQLDERYILLAVRNDTYFENNVNVFKYNIRKNLEKINEPVNKTTWSMPPSTVNAYYTTTKNQMVFPAGILQAPFYSTLYPASLNYGGMGVVMGHELTHGFDDQGREFDKDGNLHQWWKNETIDRFKKRTGCIAEQYSRYQLNGKTLDGNLTLGENIADNGGLKAAYHAYLSHMGALVQQSAPQREQLFGGAREPEALPGLAHLNHKQLFFVAFAQVWCSTATKESLQLQLEKDPHSVPRYRVIGSLSNLKEFGEQFKCKLGSTMNPKNKCEVW